MIVKVHLINRKHVGEFLLKCEANMKEFIRNYVRSIPSKGKTIL